MKNNNQITTYTRVSNSVNALSIAFKVLLFFSVCFLSSEMYGQQLEGVAYYKSKMSVSFDVSSDSVSQGKLGVQASFIKQQLAKQFEKEVELHFNGVSSIYFKPEKLEAPSNSGITFQMIGGNDEAYPYYVNRKKNVYQVTKNLNGKLFNITESLPTFNWKMTGKEKEIGKYKAYEAIGVVKSIVFEYNEKTKQFDEKENEEEVRAWYTPEIPVQAGPDMFNGLPGLILELHADKTIYLCYKISLDPGVVSEIEPTIKGKKISQKDFDALEAKKQRQHMEYFNNNKSKSSEIIIIGN